MEARDIGKAFLSTVAGMSEEDKIHAMYARMTGLPVADVVDIPTDTIVEIVTNQGNKSLLDLVLGHTINSMI